MEKELIRLHNLLPTAEANWGKMNVCQMLAHLNDAFRLCFQMRPCQDKSNFFTHYIIFPVMVYGFPSWPKNLPTASELNQLEEGTKPKDFYTELAILEKMLEIFEERPADKLGLHPLFGKLTKNQWRSLFKKHLDHHFKQFGV